MILSKNLLQSKNRHLLTELVFWILTVRVTLKIQWHDQWIDYLRNCFKK